MEAQQISIKFGPSEKLSPQEKRILEVLSTGEWVECYQLVYKSRCLQYGARIKALRDKSYNIENRTETINGEKPGWFRLIKGMTF